MIKVIKPKKDCKEYDTLFLPTANDNNCVRTYQRCASGEGYASQPSYWVEEGKGAYVNRYNLDSNGNLSSSNGKLLIHSYLDKQAGRRWSPYMYITIDADKLYDKVWYLSGMRTDYGYSSNAYRNIYKINKKTGIVTLIKSNSSSDDLYFTRDGRYLSNYSKSSNSLGLSSSETNCIILVYISGLPSEGYDQYSKTGGYYYFQTFISNLT